MKGNIFVVGLGLIGGSLALAIKKEHSEATIIGFDVNEDEAKLARSLKVIDEIAVSLEDGMERADVIILATPVMQTENILADMLEFRLKETVIVTDVGSTKQRIVKQAERLLQRGITFIGGHPMAGSHKSGVTAARAHLFENAFYVLTPTSEVPSDKVERLQEWLKGTKAQFVILSPREHDRITGVISHFPHIIAASLVHQAQQYESEHALVSRLAAGGFRDITRIASSNPEMWRDIFIHNKEELLALFDRWLSEMNMIRSLVEQENSEKIYHYFLTAKQFRDGLPVRTKGAIPSFYDLYVDVPDYPGVISEITGYLAKENISITNIRIIETREEIYGVLRLSFQSEEDRAKAKACIKKHTNYETYEV
ncbi:prephenate dehydrogenase [Thermaerobacillus caldiproteolyticus]|uniref:Prephenate dehydrogenase n=1 Tax=Thermaerobacillus caldiproteolyticus TaxID=247480 RepID=A0A7V9Z6M4_9BACL|nr:prephenate dehydrogenase [Anoxybacillus caldiproteolyticus]MBA2875042.1 prephenate dehydrogenase [Anoxybacillus caldiproteolyticus]QPA32978.1 prephenate dehydrogenase [Anoxybacillus caldiproteolyticus]